MGKALLDFLVGAAIIVAPQHNFALAAGSLALKVGLKLTSKKDQRKLAKNGQGHAAVPKSVLLEWDRLSVAFHNKKTGKTKTVFQNISGAAKPGRLLAIMGASSAGKTTLLNCLAQQLPYKSGQEYSGVLRVNGGPAESSEHSQAYIQQDDIFYSQLTVRETLMTAARLQLGPESSIEKAEALVESLIQKLGLSKSADTIVGSAKVRGLSGGERKRLSIACGLLGDPLLIYADEPTTGLDSFQAEQVMKALKDLADEGKTVVVAIHQPRSSIFTKFSDLILLSEGGIVYNGPADEAVSFFEDQGYKCPPNYNPAEFLTDLISVDVSSPERQRESEERVSKLKAAYASQSPSLDRSTAPEGSSHQTEEDAGSDPQKQLSRWGLQGRVLLERSWKQIKRDKATTVARVMSNVSSAIIFGSIYWRTGLQQSSIQNRMGLLQVAAINCAMSSVTKTLNVFAKERVIVERERSKKSYDVAPYFGAKLLAESPIGAVFPLIFGALLYPAAGLHPKLSRFGKFLGILTLESFASSSIGLAVGSVAPSPDAAQAIGPAVMVIFIVFGGYYVNSNTVPRVLQWVPRASLIKYAFEALCVNEFKDLEFQPSLPASAGDALQGEQVLQRLSFERSTIKSALAGEVRVILMNYWITYCVLKARAPKYQQSSSLSEDNPQIEDITNRPEESKV